MSCVCVRYVSIESILVAKAEVVLNGLFLRLSKSMLFFLTNKSLRRLFLSQRPHVGDTSHILFHTPHQPPALKQPIHMLSRSRERLRLHLCIPLCSLNSSTLEANVLWAWLPNVVWCGVVQVAINSRGCLWLWLRLFVPWSFAVGQRAWGEEGGVEMRKSHISATIKRVMAFAFCPLMVPVL